MKVPNEVVKKMNRIIELEKRILKEKGSILRWAIDHKVGLLFIECLSQNLSGEQFKSLAESEVDRKGNIPLFAWSYISEKINNKGKKEKQLFIPSIEFLHALSLKAKYEDQSIVLWSINQGGAYLEISHGIYQKQLYNHIGGYVADLIENDQIASDLSYFSEE